RRRTTVAAGTASGVSPLVVGMRRIQRGNESLTLRACPSFVVVPMPEGIGAVDLMIGFPHRDRRAVYDYLRKGAKDPESKDMSFLAEYMFKDVPGSVHEGKDPVGVTIAEMDRYGIDIGLVGLTRLTLEARDRYPSRFLLSLEANPNDVMEAVRSIRRAKDEQDLAAVTFFPAGCPPHGPVGDPEAVPGYAGVGGDSITALVEAR